MSHKWNSDFASENPEHAKMAPATGPDTRQPDMVCREAVIALVEQLGNTVFIDRFARVIFMEEVRKL